MKITIPRQELLDAVNKVKTVVSPRSALPILSHILMEAEESSVKLTATDLKVSIECSVDATVERAGSLTVSSQRLASVLSELPEEPIVLELSESNVVALSCGLIETKLFSMSPEEFPPVRDFEGVEPVVLGGGLLKKLFWRTSFAICSDQARYNLTGLLFEMSGSELVAVATDGRRMSLCKESADLAEGVGFKVIVPGKMVTELERLLGDEDEVSVYMGETQGAFAFGSVRLVTALIEGSFPNYETVVPKKLDRELILDTAAFLEGVRRTRTMTNDKFNSVRFGIEAGLLRLRVVTPEVGEYNEEIAVDYEGEPVEIAFNPDFILDVLRRVDGEQVCFALKDAASPGVLRPANAAENMGYVNVIMPIRI